MRLTAVLCAFKRTIKVTTRPRAAGGLRVTLNWTQDE